MTDVRYKNQAHYTVYNSFLSSSPYRYGKRFLAAVFLLSASSETLKRAKPAIAKKRIDFSQIDRRVLGAYGYTLIALAQDIYENTTHINLYEISDRYLISEKTFDLAISALKIARGDRKTETGNFRIIKNAAVSANQ